MNKNEAISKINKYGKIGRIITIVMMVILGVLIVTTLAASICLKVLPKDVMTVSVGTQAEVVLNPTALDPNVDTGVFNQIVDAINNNSVKAGLNLGAVSMELETAEVIDNKVVCTTGESKGVLSLNSIGNMLIFVVVTLVLTLVSVFFGFVFCKSIEKCQSPFEDGVIKGMRNLAFSLLPWAVFSSVPEYATNAMFSNNVEISNFLDMNVIFTVLIILALTVVFKYGAILQQESDETL